jgi:peptidoglycan/LPS O-acetylase OafA/YrhL
MQAHAKTAALPRLTRLAGDPEDPSSRTRFAWRLAPYEGHFAALDGLRGFAILLVFLYHCVTYGEWREPFTFGWCGIELFFVLSGFLITGLILDAREEPHGLRNFYVRRALRILPLYYTVLALLYVSLALSGEFLGSKAVSGQVFFWAHLQNLFVAYAGWPKPLTFSHFWSLGIEVQFYLLWPLVLRRASTRTALMACGAFALLSFALRNALPVTFPFSYTATFTHLEGVMAGSALALGLREHRARVGQLAPLACAVGGAGLAVLWLTRGGLHVADPLVMRYSYALFALFCGGVLAALLDRGRAGRWTRAFFERAPLRFLGRYSYGIFLIHWIVHLKLEQRLMESWSAWVGNAGAAAALAFLSQVVVTLVLSVASFHVIEEPFLRLKNVFAPRPRGVLTDLAPSETRKSA